MALPKQHRLRSSRSFAQVYRLGKRANGKCIAVKALQSSDKVISENAPSEGKLPLLGIRFGVSISRKVSKKAVVRNRIKRRIQSALKTLIPRSSGSWWVVVTVRSVGVHCEYAEFLRELEQTLTKLEVIDGH